VPGEFKSYRNTKAISCNVKAAEGYLFPLKSSIVFIHKPVMYIRHSELRHVEFSRTGAGRTFDVTLSRLDDDQPVTLMSIDRDEHKVLVDYFTAANIKMKTVDTEGNRSDIKDG
jgi:structure-specific recognition protein 1